MPVAITLGNTAIIEAHDVPLDADGKALAAGSADSVEVRRVRVPRGDLGQQETRFEFPDGFPSETDLATVSASPQHGARMRALPEAQQGFYLHLLAVDDAWWAAHSDAAPAWVEVDGDGADDLAQLVADHFSTASSPCVVGRGRRWKPSPPPENQSAASAAALTAALEEIGAA